MGNLTGLLARIKRAVEATEHAGERSGGNPAFVDAVARTNVLHTVADIRKNSVVFADLERQSKIKIVGAMYDLGNGAVTFLS